MSSTNLIRWSGLACILCGLLLPVSWVLEIVVGSPRSDLTDTFEFVSIVLLVFALMGIYGFQIEETGAYGFLGFLLTILTSCIALSMNWLPEAEQPEGIVGMLAPLMGITGLSGYILLGIGSWKTNKLPRWTAVMWPLGWVISLIGMVLVMSGIAVAENLHVIGILVWAIGVIGAGVKLWSGTVEAARKPEAAT